MATAFAPGRCTIVGEHVDYAGGTVVCVAVQLGVSVTLRESAEGPRPDAGALPLATLQALRERGIDVPTAVDVDITATLPQAAGLSSSAALCGATAVAALRLCGTRLQAGELAALMLHAERDIVGVPCGPLDQRAVVHATGGHALVLDCAGGGMSSAPWPDGYVLAACHTGDTHDVGGEGYRTRRREAEAALAGDPALAHRARHITSEPQRAVEAAGALRRGDMLEVGRLMSESHASLRDDYEVSTPALDAVVAAAQRAPGCLGARLCGGGFGGTAIALVPAPDAAACLAAMQAALDPAQRSRGGWLLRPSPGLAELAPDVVA